MPALLSRTRVGRGGIVQVPVNILERIGKNIRESGAVEALVSSDIFSISEHWDYMIRLVKANSTEAKFLRVDEDTDLLLFELILSDSNGSIARCKLYFLPQHYALVFHV